MTGRGVDQILPHPGDHRLWETSIRDARDYVELAERVNGRIPSPVDFRWIWGDALDLLDEFRPAARIVNLETSITRSGDLAAGKGVHYRMDPENVDCLTVAGLDAVALANNHVLDFGPAGLLETLDSLAGNGIRPVGAGRDLDEATRSVTIPASHVIMVSCGAPSSGIPASWAATDNRAGVYFLPDLSASTAAALTDRIETDDIVIVSIHWGGNWGYDVPAGHVEFAHRLIDGGVDIVYGHSSHHPRPVEIYRGKLILYGCGDLIDDYEGIGRYQQYRDDLRLLYFVSVEPVSGNLVTLRMAPMQARQLRLHRASRDDTHYLRRLLERISAPFAIKVEIDPDGLLRLPAESYGSRTS